MKTFFSISVFSFLMTVSSFLLSGCISDVSEDCNFPVRLKFSYTFNREDTDLLREEIDRLILFLYEPSSGKLVGMNEIYVSELDDDNSFVWKAPPGRHTLVVWGCSDDEGMASRFSINRAGDGFFSHTLSIVTEIIRDDETLIGVPQSDQHLWHSCRTDIIIDGDVSPVHEIDLRKVSNDVKVNVYLEGFSSPLLSHCILSASNGKYNALGQVSATVPTLYLPITDSIVPKPDFDFAHSHQFTILGLWASDDSHLSLSMPGIATPVYDGSLTELIDRLPYLDYSLDDTFILDFFIKNYDDGNLGISVRINDWDCVDYKVSLK